MVVWLWFELMARERGVANLRFDSRTCFYQFAFILPLTLKRKSSAEHRHESSNHLLIWIIHNQMDGSNWSWQVQKHRLSN